MVPDGRYTAVVDRFETGRPGGRGDGERAVLLVEDDEDLAGELAVRPGRLPAEAREQDAVLRVTVRNGILVSARRDPDETERRSEEAQSRFDRLAERPDDSGSERTG
ncbi:DUF3006 domain-containing protein [Halorussus salilacus]|uniref:DUF3006 domain-containing protein n=1 Tax=Halorussus salilacus TaxID=2953750 RepID=UPI00209F64EF|nr:DUF3006 domain-containing protein [Halorussus salilacus]USZ68507.1 DUF3006 domain-containing protein [Halorussus salilacus]